MEKRNVCVDSMKGLAIIGVVLTHVNGIEYTNEYFYPVGKLAGIGARGVQIFFMVSAFLMFSSLKHFRENRADEPISLWYFHKLFRLLPLFYIANILWLIMLRGGVSELLDRVAWVNNSCSYNKFFIFTWILPMAY